MREADEQEKEIVEHFELIEKHHGHQGQEIVLLIILLIGRVPPWPARSIQIYMSFLFGNYTAEAAPEAIAPWKSFRRLLLLCQQRVLLLPA